jgi:RNA polymerase sigma-70 factor, ECF subfamily
MRGGDWHRIELDDAVALSEDRGIDVLAIDGALNKLAALDAEQAQIVELRFFSGLSIEETADYLEMSPATVKRYWASARAFLHREVSGLRTGGAGE